MVLYFIQPSPRPEDVKNPRAMLGAYNAFKFFQWGLVAGLGVGLLRSTRAAQLSWDMVKRTSVTYMRNACAISTFVLAPTYTVLQVRATPDADDLQQAAFDCQHDKAQTRLQCLTLYGVIAGAIAARRLQGRGFIESGEVYGVQGGGATLGGLAGYCADFPVSVFVPIYISHIDDIECRFPELAGFPPEE